MQRRLGDQLVSVTRKVFKEAGGHGPVVIELSPFTTVTLVKSEQGWMLIAKDGKALGYVADGSLRKLN